MINRKQLPGIARSPSRLLVHAAVAGVLGRKLGSGASAAYVIQESTVAFSGTNPGASTTKLLPQATTVGSTLVVHMTGGYWQTLTIEDSAGGTVAGGQWQLHTDGDPRGTSQDRQWTWVRRNCPAGLVSVTTTTSAPTMPDTTRVYAIEVGGLSNVSVVQVIAAVALVDQTAVAVTVPGAGFLSVLVNQNPSRNAVSASAGSLMNRLGQLPDGSNTYGATSEHVLRGISTAGRTFNTSWPDGLSLTGYHGVFIPA